MEKQSSSSTPAGSGNSGGPDSPGKVHGVFSCEEFQLVGTGASTRKVQHKTYWFCRELADGNYEVQAIGPNHIPTGPAKPLSRKEFLKLYLPEPAMYYSLVYPCMVELDLTITRGDRYRNIKKYDRAEKEYSKAVWIDEDNIRATFGLALTYLGMEDLEKANLVFERLVALDAAFLPEHKHLFNELGIKLRKNSLYSHAVTYYSRAMELTKDDENLLFNLARAHFDRGEPNKSLEYAIRAMEINAALEPAAKLLRWILVKKLVPAKKREKTAAFLALNAPPTYAEEDLDAFLDGELDAFLGDLDDEEDASLPPDADGTDLDLADEEETAPRYDDAAMKERIAVLEELLAGQPARQTRPGSHFESPEEESDSSESYQRKAPAPHWRKRTRAVRVLRRPHKTGLL